MNYYTLYFGSEFNSGAYGASTYDNTATTGTTGTGSTSTGTASAGGSTSVLTNTGFDIAVSVTVASVLVFVALMVRLWKRPTRVAVPVKENE